MEATAGAAGFEYSALASTLVTYSSQEISHELNLEGVVATVQRGTFNGYWQNHYVRPPS